MPKLLVIEDDREINHLICEYMAETDDFSIQAIKGKKVVIPVFGRNTDASLGIFKLKGSVALLNVLQRSGIGVRRSTGNGKFEVLG